MRALAIAIVLTACTPAPVVDRTPAGPPASTTASAPPPSGGRLVPITPKISVAIAPPWDSPEPTTRNMVDFVRPDVRMAAIVEARGDHADAARRLAQTSADYSDPVTWVDVCGWPGFERRAKRRAEAPNNQPPPDKDVMTVTVTVAIDDALVTFMGIAPLDAPATADAIAALARGARCPPAPAGQTERELASLRLPPDGCCEDGRTWQGCCGTPKNGDSHQCGSPGACKIACFNQRACGK